MSKLLLIVAVFITYSCNNTKIDKPSNIISKTKLTDILTEIHETEGKINNLGITNTDTSSFLFRKLQNDILKKYNVDTTAYYQSYKYYLQNTEEYAEICKNVVEKLTKLNKLDSIAESKRPKVKNEIKTDTATNKNQINLFNHNIKTEAIKLKN